MRRFTIGTIDCGQTYLLIDWQDTCFGRFLGGEQRVTEFDFFSFDDQARIKRDQQALDTVREVMKSNGYYAYGRLDDQNRWSIAVDDEIGRVDIRIGDDGFEITLRVSSPGLFADEENEWRRRSRNRLARLMIPKVARGQLEPNQHAEWDDDEEGVAVSETWQLPFTREPDLGTFVQEQLPLLETVLSQVESQLG